MNVVIFPVLHNIFIFSDLLDESESGHSRFIDVEIMELASPHQASLQTQYSFCKIGSGFGFV